MGFPATIDIFAGTAAQGTNLLTSPDHANDHRTLGSATGNIEALLGTTSASNGLFNSYSAGQTPLPINTGTLGTTISKGTFNNITAGTPSITGGTYNNGVFGTATLQAPTFNGAGTASGTIINGVYNAATLGTPQVNGGTIGSTSVLQPLNSAFWAIPGSAGQVVGTNQTTQITWGSLNYDLLSEFGTASNNFIAKQAGLYQFYLITGFNGVATGINVLIRLNGTSQQSANYQPGNPPSLMMWQGSVPSGGTVDIAVFNNSTTNPGTIAYSQGTSGFYGKRVF